MQIGLLKCMTNFHDKSQFTECLAKANNGLKNISEQMTRKAEEEKNNKTRKEGLTANKKTQ